MRREGRGGGSRLVRVFPIWHRVEVKEITTGSPARSPHPPFLRSNERPREENERLFREGENVFGDHYDAEAETRGGNEKRSVIPLQKRIMLLFVN